MTEKKTDYNPQKIAEELIESVAETYMNPLPLI